MSWLVDNATSLYIVLGVVAAGFVIAWRFNQRVKFLGLAVIPVLLIGMLVLLAQFVVSDSRQLELSVNAMANAVQAGNVDDLFKHISKDFDYKGMSRDALYQAARKSIQNNEIRDVRISKFGAEVSRSEKLAKTRFLVSASAAGGDQPYPFVTQADFVLEGDQWKLKTVRFYNLVNQDEEIGIPGL